MGAFALLAILLLVIVAAVLARALGRALGRGPVRGGAVFLPQVEGPPVAASWGGACPARGCFPAGVAERAFAFARAGFRAPGGYAPLTPAGTDALLRAVQPAGAGAAHLGATAASARDLEVLLAASRGGTRALVVGPSLLGACRKGDDLLASALRLRVPPAAALRGVCIESGLSREGTRDVIAGKAPPPACLGQGDAARAAVAAVLAADLSARPHALRTAAAARAFEGAVGRELARLGAPFYTEDDIRAAAPGAPTPDFLLRRPLDLGGGEPLRWIDAKDYACCGARLVASGLAAQAEKYARAYGPGAMVFSGGVAAGARVAAAPADEPLLLCGAHLKR